MSIICVTGKGGIAGIPGDPFFGNPSPLIQLHLHLCEMGLARTDLMEYDAHPDLDRFKPDFEGEPTVFVGHSFGGDMAVAFAGVMPRLADDRGWKLGDIALALIDPVMPDQFWNPWRPRYEIPACVNYVRCFVRDALGFPYSSEISGANGGSKQNRHMRGEDHNSIVEAAQPDVLQLVNSLFTGSLT